ncbi:MAG: Uma2 family endonuclease [Microvirga sp.]
MTALRPVLPDRVSDAFFRDFVASRPDGEVWELIDGQIVMQAQPTFDHQIIAGNLERLLNDALDRMGSDRIALQNPAVDLSPVIVGSQYVPDVGVIDGAVEPGAHDADLLSRRRDRLLDRSQARPGGIKAEARPEDRDLSEARLVRGDPRP